ncbi:enhancing factor [Yersinia pseudotuberculosis]|nr:enhancing factor [Yersinia pseudotuberculosis]
MSDINVTSPHFIPMKSPITARLDNSDLIDERPQKINFLGNKLNSIADVNIDSKNKKITINIAEKKFSSDYIPEEYIYIAVWDAKGKMVFQKKLSDAEIKEEKIELPFEVGYQLEMYHPIPSRLVSSPDLYSIIDSNSPFTLLVMTPLGVTNPKMESYPTDIIEADFIHPNSVSVGVNADVIEPASTAEPTTSTPIAPDIPSASTSTRTGIDSTTKLMVSFQFKLLGVCDYDIATVTIDEESKLAGIKIVTDTPHCHFGDELYASIKVTDKQGHITFEEKLYGTNANISNTIIPFEKGYKLDIFHAEPSRLRVSSGDSDTLIPESK